MPIEFRCRQCGRLLRTPDEAAGKQAQCPQCGGLSPVPAGGAAAGPSGTFAPPVTPNDPFGARPSVFPGAAPWPPDSAPAGDNPYRSPTLSYEPAPRGELSAAEASGRVMGPAIGIIVSASLGILGSLFMIVSLFAAKNDMKGPEDVMGWWVALAMCSAPIFLCVLQIVAAAKMLRLQSHTLAIAGAVMALLPCNCCFVLTIPFGIWALVVLSDPAVRGAFRG